jgi:hypothetical protein
MKLNSQPIKLFLLLALGCSSLIANLTPVLAKSALQESGRSVKTANKTTSFQLPPLPPGPAPGGRARGGARRNNPIDCPDQSPELTALVPFTVEPTNDIAPVTNVWGLTTMEHPTFLFYLPYTNKTEFELQDQNSKSVYTKEVTLKDRPGIISVSLPENVPPLEVGKRYRWFLKVQCDSRENSPPITVDGVIQRVNLSQATTQKLERATPLEQFAIYAQNGIWYEAITTLAALRQKNPDDQALQTEWEDLLASFRYDDVAKQPILSESP